MNLPRTAATLAAVFVYCAVQAAALPAGEAWTERLNEVMDGAEFANANWGVLIQDLETGDTLYERNPDKLVVPASTTKLFSVATALATLGADYRFETPIYARGTIDGDGRLEGDLILVASGDLTLGGRTDSAGRIAFKDSDHTYALFGSTAQLTEQDPIAGLDDLARQVSAAGIRRVTGDVLVDDRLFEPATGTGSGPTRLTPIIVNDNVIDITITPAAGAGMQATVDWRPRSSLIDVDQWVETTAADGATLVDVTSDDGLRIVVRGSIAAGRAPLVRIAEVSDPTALARSLLIEALERAGIVVQASPLLAAFEANLPDPAEIAKLTRVAVLTSPPFSESARLILKVSHNLHASTLPLLVAVHHGQRTLADGLRREHEFLSSCGLDANSISFGGGAGGDRADYVTPRAAVHLLRHMATRPDFAVYKDALPILGEDGTLARAVGSESPARGKVQAKTGTLLWNSGLNGRYLVTSKALAGYATTAGGRKLAVAFYMNNVHVTDSSETVRLGQVLGRLCEIVYEGL